MLLIMVDTIKLKADLPIFYRAFEGVSFKYMEKLKQYKYIILILIIVSGFAFYWFSLRPSIARKDCAVWAMEKVTTITPKADGGGYFSKKYGKEVSTYDP